MKIKWILSVVAFSLFAVPATSWAQDDKKADDDAAKKKKEAEKTTIYSEVSIGAYYLGKDSYRFGKYSGLTDKGWYALADFRLEKRPDWNSGDTVRWRLQGWRLGLDSRRLQFDYSEQGVQKLRVGYREIHNYRFSDGQTPYRKDAPGIQYLSPGWEVAPGSSNTRGFINLEESLVDLKVDTRRRRMDLSYDRKMGSNWLLDLDAKHETKKGNRTLASIFGSNGGNPRSVILPAPVDWTTDTIEAMFRYNTNRAQFAVGVYGSFFSNRQDTLSFQNAYGQMGAWADGVKYPESNGRLALEPDNSYLQVRANGGVYFNRKTRLTADFSYGKMKQNDTLLPYTINPLLESNIPLPLDSLDAKVNTTMINLRLTSQLARRLALRVNYHYDNRDNKTPREVYPYVGGDAVDQRPYEDGRINLPYSYKKHKADAIVTWRVAGASRLKGGVEYFHYDRDYQEVEKSHELAWLVGISLRGWSMGSLNFDYRRSNRNVSDYNFNTPYIDSHVPGTTGEEDWENHPLLRKYFLTDRDRDEYRFRADLNPVPEINLGFSSSYAKDKYSDSYFGLDKAKVTSWSFDAGWYPTDSISLTGFYTREKYKASQSARSFRSVETAKDPNNDWWSDSSDKVGTWNVALNFSDIGADKGWKGLDAGLDYTQSDTRSNIDVAAATAKTAPLPELVTNMQSFSLWGSFQTGAHSNVRLTAEKSKLRSRDWALDGVATDTLKNVLLLGQNAANYDLWLISGSWTYRF